VEDRQDAMDKASRVELIRYQDQILVALISLVSFFTAGCPEKQLAPSASLD
jgi:hypothetical protein